jgi:Caspase domain
MRSAVAPWGRILCAATFVAAAAFSFSASAGTQAKVALVVGNGTYRNVPEIPNPPNDATDVAAAFLRLGFSVRLVTDASYDDMRKALLEFSQKARESEVAVVFFAGHGMELGGENWLIPVDAELKTDLDIEQEAISLRGIMTMVSASSKLGVVILDACRNNPFLGRIKRSIATRGGLGRGLSRVEPMTNVLVAYAARDGTTAADGAGRNSPFTTALLRHMETPGLEINFLFRHVRDDVIAATNDEQEPFIYGSLSKDAVYFKPPPLVPTTFGPDQTAWTLLKETTDAAALKRFVALYHDSPLRKEAEARIAALEEAQRSKPAPPSPDEITWAMLKETTDVAALRRFAGQYPASPLRKDADARIATLEAATEAAKSASERRELARSLQLELKRVGCFGGAVNGEFDDPTRDAWRKFAKLSSISLPDDLSPDALKAVRSIDKRVCPLICPDDQHAEGDRCVAKPANKNSEAAAPKHPAAAPRARCFAFQGSRFCE